MCGVINPLPEVPVFPPAWNGPVCPVCKRGYIQPSTTTTSTFLNPYQPKHRKPGPAQ